MRRDTMLTRITATLAFLATLLSTAALGIAAEYTLKMQTYYSPTTAIAAKFFAEQVEALTSGRVKIQVFTGGELVNSANILKSVRTGMLDIGHGMGHHFTERKSGQLESGLPMSWMSATEAEILYERRGLKRLFAEDYAKLGVVYLGPVWAASYTTLSKKPIHSLDDMRKMKIRAVGATARLLSALGINVVNLPPEDIYMALTTGQIDGVVYGNPAEYKETKFYEAAGWLNATPFLNPIIDSLIVNKKLWDGLSDDIRAAFLSAAYMTRWQYYIWSENESIQAMESIFKGKITTFSAEDQKILFKAAQKIWTQEGQKSPDAHEGMEILESFAKAREQL